MSAQTSPTPRGGRRTHAHHGGRSVVASSTRPRPRTPSAVLREQAAANVSALYTCPHDRASGWRVFHHADGLAELRIQCLFCGVTLDSLPPSEVNPHDVAAYAPFDDSLVTNYHLFRDQAIRLEWQRLEAAEKDEFRRWYWAEYLHSPWWQRRRRQALEDAGGQCQRCGLRPATQVHHLYYLRLFGERQEDLQAVCGPCHGDIHTPHRRRGQRPESDAVQLRLFN
jgi:5-methylcytosine-specific restriction endonuclease McrA